MDIAKQLCLQADILIVVGTSLQVYPAAGLINYVSRQAPIYVVDKKLPPIYNDNVISFEENASTGVKKVVELLRQS
jgi:NAD-dependent deacetylase